jgi:hypothetical protein
MHKPDFFLELRGLSTINLLAGLFILSALLASCDSSLVEAEAVSAWHESDNFSPGAQSYGVEGAVTDNQVLLVESLAWPQTRPDMVGALGFPLHFTEGADYYQYTGGRWLVILYNGPNAVGYRVEAQ